MLHEIIDMDRESPLIRTLCDMNYFSDWFSLKKNSLNVEKTKLAIFKSPRKLLSGKIKIELSGKRYHPSNSIKYLGVRIDKFLHSHDQVNNTEVKLNRTNALLFNSVPQDQNDTLKCFLVSITRCFFDFWNAINSEGKKITLWWKLKINFICLAYWISRSRSQIGLSLFHSTKVQIKETK